MLVSRRRICLQLAQAKSDVSCEQRWARGAKQRSRENRAQVSLGNSGSHARISEDLSPRTSARPKESLSFEFEIERLEGVPEFVFIRRVSSELSIQNATFRSPNAS